MMLTGHHFGCTTGALGDLCVVQCLDDVVLLQRPGLSHGSCPKHEASVETRTRAAGGELDISWIELVVLINKVLTERIADGLKVVEATVQTLHVRGQHHVEEILVEVRTDDVSA